MIDILLKNVHGQPIWLLCAGHLDNVYRLAFDVQISPD